MNRLAIRRLTPAELRVPRILFKRSWIGIICGNRTPVEFRFRLVKGGSSSGKPGGTSGGSGVPSVDLFGGIPKGTSATLRTVLV